MPCSRDGNSIPYPQALTGDMTGDKPTSPLESPKEATIEEPVFSPQPKGQPSIPPSFDEEVSRDVPGGQGKDEKTVETPKTFTHVLTRGGGDGHASGSRQTPGDKTPGVVDPRISWQPLLPWKRA